MAMVVMNTAMAATQAPATDANNLDTGRRFEHDSRSFIPRDRGGLPAGGP
ncbi:MAG: hypothetical protein RL648_99 [Verrucomicrobiota bacterium]|jgi:hypothetical protein